MPVTHEELRRSEERLGDRVELVRTETRDTIGRMHERVNELDKSSERAKTEREAMADAVAKHGDRIDKGEETLRTVHDSLKDAVGGFDRALSPLTDQISLVSDAYIEAKREKEEEKAAKLKKTAEEEEARKNWWKDWRAAMTPQNAVAVVVIVSALGAFLNGQITQAELAAQIEQAAMQSSGVPTMVEPAPTPVADPSSPAEQ